MPLLGMSKARQSVKPDAPLSTKASRYTNHQLGKNMLITKSNRHDPSLFYPWSTVPLVFLSISADLTPGELKSANLFYSYPETTHANFSSKPKSADFLKLCR
jgi:hypothetical protein